MTLRESFDKILDIVELNPELNKIFTEVISSNEKAINKQIDRLRAYNRLHGSAYLADKDNSSKDSQEHYKYEMQRLIEQFLEREYYYSFRDIKHTYDYEGQTYRSHENALNTTNCTWDGEGDILGMMELKLTHMIHNLRKNAAQKDHYIDSYWFTGKNVSKSDYNWAIQKLFDRHFGKDVGTDDYWEYDSYKNSDEDYALRLFIGNEKVSKKVSDSGVRHYYLSKYNKPGKKGIFIECKSDTLIEPTNIPPERKLYYVDFEGNTPKEDREVPQYRDKAGSYQIIAELDEIDFDKVQEIIKTKNIKIGNVMKTIIWCDQTFDIEWEDYKKLSPEMKKHIRGTIPALRELWQLRHDIIKLRSLSDVDDKYTALWENAPDKDKRRLIKKSNNLYLADRKALYQKICDNMVKNGLGWWD